MDRAPLLIVIAELMQITEDSNIHKEEALEVVGLAGIWINIWNFACLRYLTMKSWM
jgi:hypothetical protein